MAKVRRYTKAKAIPEIVAPPPMSKAQARGIVADKCSVALADVLGLILRKEAGRWVANVTFSWGRSQVVDCGPVQG